MRPTPARNATHAGRLGRAKSLRFGVIGVIAITAALTVATFVGSAGLLADASGLGGVYIP